MDIDTLNKYLHREDLKDSILQFLKTFQEKKSDLTIYRGFYLYGSSGIGKTYFIKSILKEYDIIYYTANDVRNKNIISSITKHNMSNTNVLSMFHRKNKPIVIVMDEIDNMNQGDKGGINLLLKLIRPKKTKKQKLEDISSNPIICIGNYQNDKKMNELKKSCLSMEMKSPTKIQVHTLLNHYLPNIDKPLLEQLTNGISNLNHVAMSIDIYKKDPSILPVFIENNICSTDNYNIDTKKTTQKLLSENHCIAEHQYYINEADRTTVALLLHENMIDILEPHDNYFKKHLFCRLCGPNYISKTDMAV